MMKQTARIISTYSADVMGVCSALFELGGMTVMHDASGCNSTYTTHDEPRWYDWDSMVYISGLSEMEAIMGDDEKLIGDICDAAAELHPKFIAICGTPIPTMTGFDYRAAAEITEARSGIPAFGFPTTGMKTYIDGASMALAGIAERFVEPEAGSSPDTADPADDRTGKKGIPGRSAEAAEGEEITWVNVLGLTPLDFSVNGMGDSICGWLAEKGIEVVSRWAMGSTLEELKRSARADVNLVVSAAGIGAAEVMWEKFGIPYVVGLPIGKEQKSRILTAFRLLIRTVRDPELRGQKKAVIRSNSMRIIPERGSAVIIGEGVTSHALAAAIELEAHVDTRVLCATECPDWLLRDKDRLTPDEDDIIPELEGADYIIADPLYRPICPPAARFIPLPSEAFSGRIYRNEIPDLVADPGIIINQVR